MPFGTEESMTMEDGKSSSQERKLVPIQGGEFLNLDGVTACPGSAEKQSYDKAVREHDYAGQRRFEVHIGEPEGPRAMIVGKPRSEFVGKYNTNGGIVAYVDGDNRMGFGYHTQENIEALKAAGYAPGNLTVLLNAESVINDPKLNEQFQEMVKRGKAKAEQERLAAQQAQSVQR